METTNWKVEGMTCSNCALSVTNFLQKKGLQEVKVNAISGDVSFVSDHHVAAQDLKKGIESLGYHVASDVEQTTTHKKILGTYKEKFFFSLPFTLVLMMHMLPWHIHWLMNPVVQLILCLPVFVLGMWFFGRSAIKSLLHGMPNMNVLIALGALAAFVYSMVGLLTHNHALIFFETAASIITLVFLGNWLEDWSIEKTQAQLKKLTRSQKVMANMIAYDDQHQEQIFPIENTQLQVGDLILMKTGELVPQDCKILWGDVQVNESVVTGESIPVHKKMNDILIGGSVIDSGTAKAYVSAAGEDSVMQKLVRMMQQAQGEKPPVQLLADKISAWFVPTVVGIAVLTFLLSYFLFSISFSDALMRSIAVLVISCPCAMGLATPAAIAVGLGRAARNGILVRNAKSLEQFSHIKQMVFDKTGTLTTGQLRVEKWHTTIAEKSFFEIIYSLEKFSNHPIGKALALHAKTNELIKWQKILEVKGEGIHATDKEGNTYKAVKYGAVKHLTTDADHAVYVLRNNELIGWVDVADELRPEAKEVIAYCKRKNLKTILLSGDTNAKCQALAKTLGIDEVMSEQTPEQKLEQIARLNSVAPTVMIGDGINDAPALAKATIGISLSDATQLAMQTADVVLTKNGLGNLPMAMELGKKTYGTIKSNLFWAFAYNIVAIPIAALGLLTPTFAALAMALSDVVLAGNSLWLNYKSVEN